MDKTAMDRTTFLEDVAKVVSEFEEVDAAYAFGSFIKGGDFNDVDVALLLSRDPDPYPCFKFAMKVARKIERLVSPRLQIDVKVLNCSPVEFQFEVTATGRLIFSRDDERRIDYEADLISAYLDMKYMYDILDRAFLARS